LGEICQFISDAVRAGAPLPDALAGASGLHMNASIRKPLVEWRQGLLQGAPVGRAAAVAGMPAMLVGFLDAATVPGKNAAPDELAAVMEFLARHYRVRFSHLAAVIATAVEPAVTLCLAVLVGTIVVALILPLAKLQRSVEAYGPGGFM
jgi:type II secretory pathway component PulF